MTAPQLTPRQWAYFAVIAVAVGGGGFLAGKFTGPTRVEDHAQAKQDVQAEAKQEVAKTKVSGPSRTITRVTTHPSPTPNCPDAQERVVERVVERGPISETSVAKSDVTSAQHSETKTDHLELRMQPNWHIAVSALWSSSSLTLAPTGFGASVDYRLLGPVWVGAQGSWVTGGGFAVGPRLGLSF